MTIYGIDIYDEGQSVGFLRRHGLEVKGYSAQKELRVKSISDMVTKVLATTEGQKEKVSIFLNGVGGVNYQSVGAGANQNPSGDRSLQVNGNGELNAAAKVWLPRLVGRVSGIYLAGVEDSGWSANNKGSFPLFNALANLLNGVHIRGQFGGEGSHLVYYPSNYVPRVVSRTPAERQQLRDALKKLDQK